MQQCLMLGVGRFPPHRKYAAANSGPEVWTTLDVLPDVGPDVVFDLNTLHNGASLPFPSNHFDEIHAYEVLEHIGTQGDWRGFFKEFGEYWRVLKPGGYLIGTSPSLDSRWLWGDPGHTRVISIECMSFLQREMYEGATSATDYRAYVDPRWWIIQNGDSVDGHFIFCLEKA